MCERQERIELGCGGELGGSLFIPFRRQQLLTAPIMPECLTAANLVAARALAVDQAGRYDE